MPTALIVDDDMENLLSLADVFRASGYAVETAQELRQAQEFLVKYAPAVALFNEQVGGRSSLDVLERTDLADIVEIYLMSASRTIKSASRAMRIGISD